jgi:hypothetical protein
MLGEVRTEKPTASRTRLYASPAGTTRAIDIRRPRPADFLCARPTYASGPLIGIRSPIKSDVAAPMRCRMRTN